MRIYLHFLQCGSIEHKYIERSKSRRCRMYQETERTNYGKSKAEHSSPVEWRNGIRSINWYAWAFATRTCISSLSWRYLNKLHGSRKFRRITRANELFRCRFRWEGSRKDNGNHGVNLILEMERSAGVLRRVVPKHLKNQLHDARNYFVSWMSLTSFSAVNLPDPKNAGVCVRKSNLWTLRFDGIFFLSGLNEFIAKLRNCTEYRRRKRKF